MYSQYNITFLTAHGLNSFFFCIRYEYDIFTLNRAVFQCFLTAGLAVRGWLSILNIKCVCEEKCINFAGYEVKK